MKVYSPNSLTIKESQERLQYEKTIERINLSDETLAKYFDVYFESYRKTLEDFFSVLAPHLGTYQRYPYKTTIIRWGDYAFIAFHQASTEKIVEFRDIKEFGSDAGNLFDLKKRFDPCSMEFDFSGFREYGESEAEIRGKAMALDEVLQVFWLIIANNEDFEKVCLNLIEAETENRLESKNIEITETGIDLNLEILIQEPAGFRRIENWGFIFKHYKENRITADLLHQIEAGLDSNNLKMDVICLITSGDITSIGKSIVVNNPRIRVWDRHILNQLVNKHLPVIEDYFQSYKIAVESITSEIEKLRFKRYKEFENKLNSCPSGRSYFQQYELICKEILEYLFEGQLKPFDNQSETSDGTQRRDIVFRNLRNSKFFERIFTRFNADFLIFDPKNYRNEIEKQEFESISKYQNKAIGNFAVLISREGETDTALNTQSKIFRDRDEVILSISDSNLLEMISRKERGENPEDFLEDLLDRFLLSY
ncbi:MAG: hypothetical protein M3209_12130 [Acidobacteriota bacterium]|nr:hypothetical protein [Acidobacteriota bacterium]